MRKFLFNAGVIGALVGATGVIRQTISGPRNWRLILMWLSWGIGVAIAVGSVIEQNRELDDEPY